MRFNESELGIISNALRVAAERFQENAAELQRNYGNAVGAGSDGMTRLAAQFANQATEARNLYDAIAERTGVAS